ncbi:hypothetical protein CUMW_270080 [Citrus unshiu]|uniref:Non-specific serine/threonine protein kinase n=1 Tax=Citrus unshiu TaxID=55188 RepID=A0A2H5QX47_CITUN|nr:hypothetical protein CUMW_270080 [Citrus unshiu]
MGNPPFFFTFRCFVFLLGSLLSLATDTITPATLIGDGEKLVSSSQIFELGFFSPGKSKYKYLGIWYKQVPDTVVWVANRNSPIVDSNAVLTIGNNGNLVLLNQTDGIIWSSNLSREVKNPVAQLLDTGNLVLRENFSSNTSEGSYLWQSFDCPSDTLLIGMKMGWDLKTGRERYLTSWRTADDPSPGNFTFRLEIRVLPHLCIYNGSVKLSCTGPWNGLAFGADPTNTSYLFRPIVEQKEDEIIYRYESYSSRILMMLKINPSGDVQRLIWHEMSTGWQVFFTAPNNFCQLYGYCGANSVCSVDDTANCECLKGFKLKLQNNQTWPRECVRSHSSDCITRERFIKFDDIKLPYSVDVSLNESMNLKECEAECLKNCTCRAYANSKVTGGDSGCLMWFGDLIDVRKITGYNNGQPIYIRVTDSEPESSMLQHLSFFDLLVEHKADTLTPASFIRDGEKLVSSSQRFELGFFSPGKSKNRYVGLWYQKIPDTVLWVANRNSPISDHNAVLTISNNGNLVLLNQTNGTIWSTNVSSQVKNPVARLLDNGNLVITDNSSNHTTESYLWQSFDYLTDTLLPDMKLGWDLKTGLKRYLSSWESADDPSPGKFTYGLDIQVSPKLFTYESYNSPNIMILKVNPSGLLTRLIWNERSTAWDLVFSVPDGFCINYGHCGPNSICSLDQTPICQCLRGFKLKSQNNQTWPRKCERSSDCRSGDQFIKLDDFKAPDLLEVSLNDSMNLNQCQAKCLKNCSCRAYANSKLTGGGSGCLMWFGDLIDLRKPISNFTGQSVYMRVPAPEQGNKKLLWIIVVLVLPVVLLPSFYIFRRRRRKHKEKENMEANWDLLAFDINMSITTRTNELCEADGEGNDKSKDSWLPLFSLASVSAATENFSTQCKLGEGGFGPVYKGRLLNGQEVAVKRLSNQSGQGLTEFKNEMMLIAKLQHRHLVRLFGCCIEQGENILIYEYMPNKSLDVFLFDPKKKRLLGWQARVRIIEGIAQGLLYLHQYSRLRIIHRDLKASNILLDSDMNPKISDFGMARIFGGDELQGNTKRIAWGLWKDDRAHELMDPVIKQDEVSLPMLIRYINVALLCVQENAADRPIMSDVISMIENEHLNLPSPKEPAFTNSKNMNNSSHSNSGTSQFYSVNDLTVSLIYPR